MEDQCDELKTKIYAVAFSNASCESEYEIGIRDHSDSEKQETSVLCSSGDRPGDLGSRYKLFDNSNGTSNCNRHMELSVSYCDKHLTIVRGQYNNVLYQHSIALNLEAQNAINNIDLFY
ncbi:hypothetical protein AVEN_22772-1 [Araneus ventricosus]|uniref:Uncharacterized protein n=1 Tax=Araneus ventricosus TaxID=182803 RepID=A0A4Y2EBA8_ARAVE|nr:hypothetical protein AVEN_22772-1 [Araneus ventricosus]